jgi:hypothetical protein
MPLTNRPHTLSTTVQWARRTMTRRRGTNSAGFANALMPGS